jgi:hypothetical protein
VRHFVNWRDNVFIDHDAPELTSRIMLSRSRPDWFGPGEHHELLARRSKKGFEGGEAQLGDRDPLAPILRRIPVRASIEESTFDDDVERAIEVLTACDGVKLAIATKLLCIKRPYLIPMMDRVVQGCFGSDRPLEILGEFRRLLATPEISARVDALADHVGAIIGVAPSRVRILDELIWFDWNVRPPNAKGLCEVVGFADWVYDMAQDERGVYRRTDD